MTMPNARFSTSEIMSLVAEAPRYDLAESVGPNLTISQLYSEAEISAIADMELGYGTAQGSKLLRDIIALQNNIASENVVITTGGMHALFLMSMIVCDASAHVLTVSPQFPLATQSLQLFGADVDSVRCSFDQRYRLPVDEVARALKPRTRLVCIASPQNPSGVLVPDSDLLAICALMQRVCPDAYLLVDETYRKACYDATPCSLSATHLDPRIVCVTSLSKAHGAPGLRTGWITTTDPDLRDQLVAGKFQTIISGSVIDETLALRVLEKSTSLMQQRRDHLGEARRQVAAWVENHVGVVEWVEPDRGALCCIRLIPPSSTDSDMDEFYRLLGTLKVRVAPGPWFGDEACVFRLGFGLLSLSDLDAALVLLSQAIQEFRSK